MARIDFWHNKLPGMGSRNMVVKLREDGFWVGRKLVRRYMAEMNIRAAYPKPNLSKRNHRDSILPYLGSTEKPHFRPKSNKNGKSAQAIAPAGG